MNRLVVMILAAVVLLALLSYTATYTVRYTESAVLTTFGRATEADVKKQPGLNFKWPYPIQSVTTYDTRSRFLQTVSETQQTGDNRQIIVEAFCSWRVEDPLKFFQRFSSAGERADEHYRRAEDSLRGLLRSALGAVSQFRMDQLFTSDPAGTQLPQLEQRVMSLVTAKDPSGQSLADLGISVVLVGINRVRLPEDTTTAVFAAMGANRDRIAKDIEAKGSAIAATIIAQAESNASRIRAFAERRAQEIRSTGDLEAALFLKQMNSNPQLAVFLKNMEMIATGGGKQTTLVIPTSMPGMGLYAPDALNSLKSGEVPDSRMPQDWSNVRPTTLTTPTSNAGDTNDDAKTPVSSAEGSK